MSNSINIIDVNPENLEKVGFFCRMSKMKSEGNKNKLSWLEQRFTEGLKIKMLELPNRGFIEYIPGEYAWRAVDAKGYMFIHCIWIVGKSKAKGYGTLLLKECVREAEKLKMKGVCTLVSEANWTASKELFLKNGFSITSEIAPHFQIVTKKFNNSRNPSIITNWDENMKKCGDGLTVFTSGQCPYLDDAVKTIEKYAKDNKMKYNSIELKSAKEIRKKSPSPYGAFNIVYNSKLLSHCYLLPNEIQKKINKLLIP